MVRWLYNSDGDPIAFVTGEFVYSARGDFVGKLYPDQQVWNGDYIGEIFDDDRFIYNESKLHGTRSLPGLPGLPPFSGETGNKGHFTVPPGYRDVELD